MKNCSMENQNYFHYTAFIRKAYDISWLHCNDAAVLSAKEKNLDNNSSYIYFYEFL